VTGFDDSLLADSVGLTSVRQPIAELAATVVRLLDAPYEDRGVLLPGELVLRGSAPLNPGTPDIGTPDIGTTV
jgi:DNA-binding LacI/PurR family transcriptional regulator